MGEHGRHKPCSFYLFWPNFKPNYSVLTIGYGTETMNHNHNISESDSFNN